MPRLNLCTYVHRARNNPHNLKKERLQMFQNFLSLLSNVNSFLYAYWRKYCKEINMISNYNSYDDGKECKTFSILESLVILTSSYFLEVPFRQRKYLKVMFTKAQRMFDGIRRKVLNHY